jgi:hypothetical protein
VQRVVLWDNVFSGGVVRPNVDEIKVAIKEYFGFDWSAAPNGSALHAEMGGSPSDLISSLT